jgi:hypothetical protein
MISFGNAGHVLIKARQIERGSMWIMITGPYRSGADNPEQWQSNLAELNKVAVEILKKGHTPIIGVNMALPIIEQAGDDKYESIMMPLSLELAKRCDAVLRIGGPSTGADQEVEAIKSGSGKIYLSLDEIPDHSQLLWR